jgi:hypothetical protein
VSSVAGGSLVAINGDGWDGTNTPLSYAASEGNLYQPVQYDARPYINISSDNKINITHIPPTAPYNLISGTRYLVKDGKNFFATSTNPEHITELHPRTAAGYTVDGKLILCVVDGRSENSAGITLRDLATVMIDAGAFLALELDGGGSSAMCVNGAVVNVPSDGAERPVINHMIIYGVNTMATQYKVVWANGASKRVAPTTSSASIVNGVIPVNTIVDVIQDKIPDQTYPTDVNKLWVKFTDGTYAASIYGAGSVRMVDVTPTPPPVESSPDLKVTIDAGEKYPLTTVTIKPL